MGTKQNSRLDSPSLRSAISLAHSPLSPPLPFSSSQAVLARVSADREKKRSKKEAKSAGKMVAVMEGGVDLVASATTTTVDGEFSAPNEGSFVSAGGLRPPPGMMLPPPSRNGTAPAAAAAVAELASSEPVAGTGRKRAMLAADAAAAAAAAAGTAVGGGKKAKALALEVRPLCLSNSYQLHIFLERLQFSPCSYR